jgi:hypothetical protein
MLKYMIDMRPDDDSTLPEISRLLHDQNQLITASVEILERSAALVERSRHAMSRCPQRVVAPGLPSSCLCKSAELSHRHLRPSHYRLKSIE